MTSNTDNDKEITKSVKTNIPSKCTSLGSITTVHENKRENYTDESNFTKSDENQFKKLTSDKHSDKISLVTTTDINERETPKLTDECKNKTHVVTKTKETNVRVSPWKKAIL